MSDRGSVEEMLAAYDSMKDVPPEALFKRFDVDSRALVRHATAQSTTVLQGINLGENPLQALAASFAHGVLLGLAIAEQRGLAVERLIEDVS